MYRTTLFILAIVFSNGLIAQTSPLKGKYVEVCPIWSYERNTFEFFPDYTFTFRKSSDFGEFFGAGKYSLTKDSIHFQFASTEEANNALEVLTGPVDSSAYENNTSYLRIFHALDSKKALNFSYQHYRGDSLIDTHESSPYGLSKVELQEGDSLQFLVTDWTEYFMGFPLKIDRQEPTSYVIMSPQINIGLVHQGHNETMKFRLTKRGKKLVLIRAKEPNFFHPDASGKIEYLLSK